MSGGARMLACRKDSGATTAKPVSAAATCSAGAVIDGASAKHALRHLTRSMPFPQQSSAGLDMLMLSHGVPADCAQALAAGPKASQEARSTTMRERALTRAGYQRPFRPVNVMQLVLLHILMAHLAQRFIATPCQMLAVTRPASDTWSRMLEGMT